MEKCFNDRLGAVTEKIIGSYTADKTIDEVKNYDHPNKESIIDIITKLKKIIFAGYFRGGDYRSYTLRNNVTMLIEDVLYKLSRQIAEVYRYLPEYASATESELRQRAENVTFEFLDRIPKIRDYIETDVDAAYEGDPAAFSKDEIIYSYPGIFAILVNRIAHELFLLGVPLIPRIMTEYAHNETGIDIHPGASIGKYFFIDHGTGIVIGETTEIGDNVKIYQGVTLGALSTRGGQQLRNKKRHPTIRDNVTIYSGASILGGETVVGRDVVVGGNAFITNSIPDGARVSIKNQELRYNYHSSKATERPDFSQDEVWFYVI
ncbi:MAG: serine acetyltransferase [Ruminococcus sp.]|nr:serine acetyltransferase [Ruminococcus sp.]